MILFEIYFLFYSHLIQLNMKQKYMSSIKHKKKNIKSRYESLFVILWRLRSEEQSRREEDENPKQGKEYERKRVE